MKIMCKCNAIITVCFLVFWSKEIIKSFFYDSTIINETKALGNIIIILLFIILVIYIAHSFFTRRIYRCTIVSMFTMSITTITFLYDSIFFYLPWNHNERFLISECILIYLSLFSLIWLFINLVVFLRAREHR